MSIEPDAKCTEKHYSKCKKGPEPPKQQRLRRPDLHVVPHLDALVCSVSTKFRNKKIHAITALYLFVT